ncbi:DUF4407 domain-containing protein [Mucilaginibacter ginsenosidivorans]|uniref:DUF4407 domain-containing protein n=1 Tax=Mucilaginibacter ginsenosidivorans TaxID=398053 RepID=A0A5B8UVP0_9SPHI|nr:DUF4407 domain-containing protein [Mucilaginibacter ginsenosidivorans]QEC62506.1 DUF4407 domain-containing protein [Mucilaginibacter ginsenosidivorans]
MAGITEYFCARSGEDLWVINNCGHKGIRDRFALVGAIAALVYCMSFLSCWYSFRMLFDNGLLAVPVSLLFAWMINNIYTVLLTTLSKPVLRVRYQGVIKHLSLFLRISFIVFFAVFISKPLEAWVFEPQLSQQVEKLKERDIQKSERQLNDRTREAEQKIRAAIGRKRALHYPEADLEPLLAQLERLDREKEEALARVRFVIGRADFFVQRLEILAGRGIYRLSWLFTSVVILLFLLPIYLKWRLNFSNVYFRDKRTIYEGIVNGAYRDFKAEYRKIFLEKYGARVDIIENYTDPPFNTERKTDGRVFKTQEDFLDRFYA